MAAAGLCEHPVGDPGRRRRRRRCPRARAGSPHFDQHPAVANGWNIHQDGPLRLWDQVEEALALWQKEGSTDQTAFGMTVTEWDQTVWLGDPKGPSWRLPT